MLVLNFVKLSNLYAPVNLNVLKSPAIVWSSLLRPIVVYNFSFGLSCKSKYWEYIASSLFKALGVAQESNSAASNSLSSPKIMRLSKLKLYSPI